MKITYIIFMHYSSIVNSATMVLTSRRQFLRTVGCGSVLTAMSGCSANSTGDGQNPPTSTETRTPVQTEIPTPNGHVKPDPEPAIVPSTLTCDEETFERRDGWVSENALSFGTLRNSANQPVFQMRVNELEFEQGDKVVIRLRNVSQETQFTANVHQSNLEVRTESGWQDPRGWTDGEAKPIPSDQRKFSPGAEVRWEFDLTPEGVVTAALPSHHKYLETCPGLPAGRYRFATAAPDIGDIGVKFDLKS